MSMMFWLLLAASVSCVLNAGYALGDRNYNAALGWLSAGCFAAAHF